MDGDDWNVTDGFHSAQTLLCGLPGVDEIDRCNLGELMQPWNAPLEHLRCVNSRACC